MFTSPNTNLPIDNLDQTLPQKNTENIWVLWSNYHRTIAVNHGSMLTTVLTYCVKYISPSILSFFLCNVKRILIKITTKNYNQWTSNKSSGACCYQNYTALYVRIFSEEKIQMSSPMFIWTHSFYYTCYLNEEKRLILRNVMFALSWQHIWFAFL